jgi:hypothetical protein
MIEKEDYIQAMELVNEYEKEMILHNGTPCYILFNLDAGDAIVITKKDLAERIFNNDNHYDQMKESKLYQYQ